MVYEAALNEILAVASASCYARICKLFGGPMLYSLNVCSTQCGDDLRQVIRPWSGY